MAERKAPRTAAAPGNDGEPLEELFARLGSSPEGLIEEEARDRLASGGPNALPEQRTPAWRVLLGHFWGSSDVEN